MRIYHRLLAAVMLACLAVPVGLVVYHVFDIRPISYLPVVVFLVALESMYSHYQMREISITSLKWWAYHLAELLVWIILTKLLLYALYGFDRLWIDLPAWRQDAAIFFNDPEYLFLVVTVIGVWMLSGELESLFSSLEYDEQYLQVEIDTGFSEERMELRQRLANLVIACGGLMVFLITILNLQSGTTWSASVETSQAVVTLVVYFLCGLALLSLTQLSILRVRWVIEHLRIERRITTRWFAYSTGLILLLALIALLLPTGYSGQLLQIFQIGIAYLLFFLQIIIYFLTYPFILLFGWLMKLFNRPVDAPAQPPGQIYPPPLPISGEPVAWLELVKTALFWVGLIGLVSYAFIYYFREHPEYFHWLGKSRLYSGFAHILQQFIGWLRGVNRQAAQAIEGGFKRLRARSAAPVVAVQRRFTNPRLLTPRDQVRFYYLALVRHGERYGIPRAASQTPNEYSETLKATIIKPPQTGLPAGTETWVERSIDDFAPARLAQDLSALTDEFIEARYSQHEITGAQASLVRRYWEHILQTLRARR